MQEGERLPAHIPEPYAATRRANEGSESISVRELQWNERAKIWWIYGG